MPAPNDQGARRDPSSTLSLFYSTSLARAVRLPIQGERINPSSRPVLVSSKTEKIYFLSPSCRASNLTVCEKLCWFRWSLRFLWWGFRSRQRDRPDRPDRPAPTSRSSRHSRASRSPPHRPDRPASVSRHSPSSCACSHSSIYAIFPKEGEW